MCQNRPYTYKSDIWALGCVLYEMCVLEHAFLSTNLLGLIYKIVKEDVPDIPLIYSRDLNILLSKLLHKEEM